MKMIQSIFFASILCLLTTSTVGCLRKPCKPPPPVNGNWGSWSVEPYACGCDGFFSIERHCNNPAPENGGSLCDELMKQTKYRDCDECACKENGRIGGCEQKCSNTRGSRICSCRDRFTKNGNECEEKTCKTGDWPTPSNGRKTTGECSDGNAVGYRHVCYINCNPGYKLVGYNQAQCGDSGKWYPSFTPTCQEITCVGIKTQNNVDVNPSVCKSNPRAGTSCTISCKNGFSLIKYSSSQVTTICSNVGQWSKGNIFYCRDLKKPVFKSCQKDDIVANADNMKTIAFVKWKPIKAEDNDGSVPTISVFPVHIQSTATSFEFKEGIHHVEFTATDSSGNRAHCIFKITVKVIRCPVIVPPINGRAVPRVCSTLLKSKCNYECNEGFNLTTGSFQRECIPNGESGNWTGKGLTCERIACPSIPVALHSVRSGLGCSDTNPTYQTFCHFECTTGYQVTSGSKKRICKANGQWTGDDLQCEIVTCPALPQLSEGLSISNPACIYNMSKYNEECQYSCARGYVLLGPTRKICSQTGLWSPGGNAYCKDMSAPSFQSCTNDIEILADRHSRSVNVNWSVPLATDNAPNKPSVIHQGKKPGDVFTAGHHTIRYIATDKAGNTAQCLFQVIVKVIKCSIVQAPLRGTMKCSLDNVYGSQCTFQCNIGYAIKGSVIRTCEKDGNKLQGQWTGNSTYCEAITCPFLGSPNDGYKSGCLTNSFGEKCLFYCNRGYKAIAGSNNRTCLENRTWTGSNLICKAVNCAALISTSSQVSIIPGICSSNPPYQVTCQYLCPAGYRLHGLSIKTCLGNGLWNHNGNVSCQDIERPTFTTPCPYSIDVFAPKNRFSAVVKIPAMTATDNSGEVPVIRVTGQKHNYSAGKHAIIITATDSSGNKETCRFFINVKVLRCSTHPVHIANGKSVDRCANIWGSTCHFKCNEGYSMIGLSSRTCNVMSGQIQGYWNGTMPFCRINRCHPLKTPVNGHLYPPMCITSGGPVSNTACLFGCYNGFSKSAGVNEMICGKDGKWGNDISSIITCKDKTPPNFKNSCPLDIRISLGINGLALANWTIPVAEDNTKVLPKLTVDPPNIKPPFAVSKTTLVTYTANDKSGNVGKCSFKVIVEDNEGPRVVFCPANITKEATQLAEIVTWRSPVFADNSNLKVKTICNRKCGDRFYWGVWNIICRGHDNNPDNPPALCKFTVTVTPKPCPPLRAPENGAKSCAAWMLGFFCTPMCNDKYDFAEKLMMGAMWVCGSSGKWFPQPKLPDCSATYTPGAARKANKLLYYFTGNCHNADVQERIKVQFIAIIKTSMVAEICTDPQLKEKCNVSNVDVECGMKQSQINDPKSTSSNKRKRRSLAEDREVMKITFVVSILMTNTSHQKQKQQIQTEVKETTTSLEEITSEIQKMANNGSLALKVTNLKMTTVNGSFSSTKISFTCKEGQIFTDKKCISCPVGTFHNATQQKCLPCPKGTYQDVEAQVECIRCPSGMSTVRQQSINESDCLDFCSPGYTSPTGLDPCMACAKGTFQSQSGQVVCVNCQLNTTTQKEGSTSSANCSVPCAPGSFSINGLHPCHKCGKRSYLPSTEGTSCYQCPGTTITIDEGCTRPSQCLEINECLSRPCRVGSACIDLIGDYACLCQQGYTGRHCETDINECASTPCQNNRTCTDLVNDFKCHCPQGYTGKMCETDINECKEDPCLNDAMCRDLIGRYECLCLVGFEGHRCEKNINDCLPNPCLNGGICKDKLNAFYCQCPRGYRGSLCQENINDCSPNPCTNGGQCKDGIDSYSCICQEGYSGGDCEIKIDECKSSPCQNNATCYAKIGGFTCVCMHGYNGTLCEQDVDYCLSNPCKHGGSCKNGASSFSCACNAGFQGDNCEKDVDECSSQPCTNNATCVNTVGSYKCNCISGFTGQACQTDIDECLSNQCLNYGRCENLQNGFICNCMEGFTGPRCQVNIDECATNPCKYNGTCYDLVNAYKCTCNRGFTGKDCQTNINHCANNPCTNNGLCQNLPTDFKCTCANGFDGKNCSEDINECLSSPCHNGQCEDLVGGFRCSCRPGFTGTNCTYNIDDCIDNECSSNGTCVDGNNTYHCECNDGFTGKYCELLSGPCKSFPCANGGECKEKNNRAFICSCRSGFTGQHCQENIDDCSPNPCKYNGICIDLISNYTCNCPNGFSGNNCEKFTDYCANTNCSNHGNCINHPSGFSCNCTDDFYGTMCEFRFKQCISSPCNNGATCNETSSGFNCTCRAGFTGRFCDVNIDECKEHKCLNNATCVDKVDDYLCLCHNGFRGTYCEEKLHSCKSSPCKNNGTCEDIFDGYRCRCPERYGGRTCSVDRSPCLINPCLHGGVCTMVDITTFRCTCQTGYTDKICQTNIDDCASAPCAMNANCIDKLNGYECKCIQSYTGTNCTISLGDNFDLVFQKPTPDSMVVLPPSSSIPDTISLSILMWVKPDVGYERGILFTYKTTGKDGNYIEISFTKTQIRVLVQHDELKNDASIADGKWHLIGASWSRFDTDFSIYLDGKLIRSSVIPWAGPPMKGGGEVVLGKKYSLRTKGFSNEDSFVGTLHQVNFWHMPVPNREYMWNAAHRCSWPLQGNVYPWISFLPAAKKDVLKKFPSSCKALDICKENCSHIIKCNKQDIRMVCTCKEGFTGDLCDININDCLSYPCIHGKCVDDIASYRCDCKKGYFGKQCEHEQKENDKECPPLDKLPHGKFDMESYEGKRVIHLKCDEKYSFRHGEVTSYECGQETGWKWNNQYEFTLPRCLVTAEPYEVRQLYSLLIPMDPTACKTAKGYQHIEASFKQEIMETIANTDQYGCFLYGPCSISRFSIPTCDLRIKPRATRKFIGVLFEILAREWGNSTTYSTVTETSEAVMFHLKYAVSYGSFELTVNNKAIKPRPSSFKKMSKVHQCKEGYVDSRDDNSCVACPVGSYQYLFNCLLCPKGQYQDAEATTKCIRCPVGYATNTIGSTSKKMCIN